MVPDSRSDSCGRPVHKPLSRSPWDTGKEVYTGIVCLCSAPMEDRTPGHMTGECTCSGDRRKAVRTPRNHRRRHDFFFYRLCRHSGGPTNGSETGVSGAAVLTGEGGLAFQSPLRGLSVHSETCGSRLAPDLSCGEETTGNGSDGPECQKRCSSVAPRKRCGLDRSGVTLASLLTSHLQSVKAPRWWTREGYRPFHSR